jgi:predicted helicase
VEKGDVYVGGYEIINNVLMPVEKKAAKKGVVRVPNFIGKLVREYYVVDGIWLGEKNPKWLQDDYVKFIRFAEWRIARTEEGVLGYITNHGYLDNPTFRGMRQHLMQTFNKIYILDLHGNSKKKEKAPDGGKDDNVFDIQQGVAILLCIKEKGNSQPARVLHANLWGAREAKYNWLAENDVNLTEWAELKPSSSLYLFVPQDTDLQAEYEEGLKLSEIFPTTLLGPNSHRDDFAIAFTGEEAAKRISDIADQNLSDDALREKYGIHDTRDWKLREARRHDFKHVSPVPCIYRPFDFRFMLYGQFAFDYHRPEINDNLLKQNLAIISTRQTKEPFSVLATNKPAGQHKLATSYDGSYLSPLYLYPSESAEGKTLNLLDRARRPNLSLEFLKALAEKLQLQQEGPHGLPQGIKPEDIFHYAYAVFCSPTYRTRYAEFLKIDFPRLPLTTDASLFHDLAAKGAESVALHIMESPKLEEFITDWPVKGDNVVEKVQYTDKDRRVWINKTQYFEGVPAAVWEFHIGGYQVCDKWLKDRKRRALSYDDIMHYQKVIVALKETIRLMREIDEIVSEYGGWPEAFQASKQIATTEPGSKSSHGLPKAAEDGSPYGNDQK